MGDLSVFSYERGEGIGRIGNREGGEGLLFLDVDGRHFSVIVGKR